VAEAAVVGKPHDVKGESVFAYVVLRGDRPSGDKVAKFTQVLRDWVSEQLGAIARPDDIRFTDNLPKTRSGKIMRRLLRAIARNEDITQDLSTLENPAIIDQLRGPDPGAAASGAEKPLAEKPAAEKPDAEKRRKAKVPRKAANSTPRKAKAKAKRRPAAAKRRAPGKAAAKRSGAKKRSSVRSPKAQKKRPVAKKKSAVRRPKSVRRKK
jgi:hypothetical protein